MSQSKGTLVRLSVPVRLVVHESATARRFTRPEGSDTAYLDILQKDIFELVSKLRQERRVLGLGLALASAHNIVETED